MMTETGSAPLPLNQLNIFSDTGECKNRRNEKSMKKALQLFAVTSLLSIIMTATAFAGTWKQNDHGWWWQDEDKSYPVSGWKWIDSNGDGMAECYYFDENGYLLTGTLTPDGYTVNENGAWTDSGILRQRAANPFAARTVNQKGLDLYQSADLMSSQLQGMDVKSDILINMSYSGLEIPISVDTQLKYHDINTPGMEFLYIYNMNTLGILSTQTAFYTNGCYYSDTGSGKKYKMKVGYSDMSDNLTLGGLTGQFGAFLENVQIADDGAGNKLLFYSSDTSGLENYLAGIYDEILPSLSYYDFKINQITGKAVISPEGYFSKEEILISTTLSDGEDSMDTTMSIHLDYNNPGQPVTIQFPSTDGFEEVVY